jgi:hypothetical protein
MRNRRSRKFPVLFMVCCLCGICISTALAVDVPNKKEIIAKARQSYYNLHTQGLAGFHCDISPNLDLVVADQRKTDPAGADRSMSNLKGLRISMSLDPENNVQVTRGDLPPMDTQAASERDRIFGALQQVVTGFYQTATPFILDTAFPEVNGVYQLEDQSGQYRLSYKDGNADAVILMDKDLIMNRMDIGTPDFTAVIQPRFLKNPNGYLLSGYSGIYKSKSEGQDIKLNVQITYQDVGGLQLPQKLGVAGSNGSATFAQEVFFSGYQVTKK